MTQYNRVYNFSAGPSMLPVEVLENVQKELLNYQGSGQIRHGDEPSFQGVPADYR